MEIKSLGKTNFDTIFRAFKDAFEDYELQLNELQLQTMLKRRGFNPDLSFAAFEGKDIIAFTFNGIGYFNGIATAYDTGTGTLKQYRGQGVATKIFEYSIPYLKEMNIKQYLLEVLQHNTKAVSVYRKLGFEISREFNYFMQRNEEVKNETKQTDIYYSIKQVNLQDLILVADFWDFYPSWQNSFDSIQRAAKYFICLGAFRENKMVGYSVFEPASGDITQLALDKKHRRKGIASLLLEEVLRINRNNTIKMINTDILCNSITEFLHAKNISLKGKQFEMTKEI